MKGTKLSLSVIFLTEEAAGRPSSENSCRQMHDLIIAQLNSHIHELVPRSIPKESFTQPARNEVFAFLPHDVVAEAIDAL